MSNSPQNQSKRKYLKSFISGGCAGIVAKSVIAPLDRVKILFVTSSRKFTYNAAINEATNLYKTQGLKSLWRGNTATAIRVFPYSAIQFASFDYFQNFFRRPEHTKVQKNMFNFLSGSLTGIVSTAATYPLDFIRTRMAIEVEVHAQKSIVQAVQTVYRTEGVKAFYHGIIPSLTGIIPYHGVGFGMYHLLKGYLIENHPHWKQSKIFDFLFGAIAGLGAQLVAYPFDVIRKKMQVQAVLLERGEITQKKGGLLWVKHTIKTEGVKGMYKGITMNLIKGPISTGTSFMVKNIVNRILDKNYAL